VGFGAARVVLTITTNTMIIATYESEGPTRSGNGGEGDGGGMLALARA